ncbi:MAG: hypothetical protein ACRELG_18345 [Gemmataceae bacterium]
MMRTDGKNPMVSFSGVAHGLALLIGLSSCHFITVSPVAAQQDMVSTAPEPPPRQPPVNNWFNVDTPGTAALARPDSFLPYGPPPDGVCCPGNKSGSCIRRLIAWATYHPKIRVCSCTSCCNSCQYKGFAPLYLTFLNPKCVAGSNLHRTFANECYRGCANCAGGHP